MNHPLASLRPGPIDIHAHIMPEGLIARLRRGERQGFAVEIAPDGPRRVILGGEPLRAPILPGMDSMEIRLATMDEHGVAAQLLSPWIALAAYRLSEADGIWFSEALNTEIAATVKAMPDRFIGIGTVPLQAPGRAVEILRWSVQELGLLGVEISTTVTDEMFLDDQALEPFWAAAEELGAFVMIHPSLGGTGQQFARYYLNNLIHNPVETTVAAAHLIFSGVMERYPKLKICLVHGGGYLPYAMGRLKRGRLVRPETKVAMRGSVEESFGRFYFDTVTHSVSILQFLASEVGAERVLLGSDYPFDMADPIPVETVRHAAFDPAAEDAVLRGNAERLLQTRSDGVSIPMKRGVAG